MPRRIDTALLLTYRETRGLLTSVVSLASIGTFATLICITRSVERILVQPKQTVLFELLQRDPTVIVTRKWKFKRIYITIVQLQPFLPYQHIELLLYYQKRKRKSRRYRVFAIFQSRYFKLFDRITQNPL
jgi:hypothetical protein